MADRSTISIAPPPDVEIDAPPDVGERTSPDDERTLGGFGKNLLTSTGDLIADTAKAVASPVRTGRAMGELLQMPRFGANPTQQAFMESLMERYGSLEGLASTLYEDPAGALADLSSVLGGAGLAAKSVPGAARLSQGLRSAAAGIDPVTQIGRGATGIAGMAARPVAKITEAGLGATTGAGSEAINIALTRNTKAFTEAMRGKVEDLDIVRDARSALQDLRNRRGQEYRSRLDELRQSEVQVDLTSVRNTTKRVLEDFRAKRSKKTTPDPTPENPVPESAGGGIDFSSAAVGRQGQKDIAQVVDLIDGWTDTSALGVDALKRRLDDFYSESGQARAFVNTLKGEVRQALDSSVPGYKQMTRDYAAATEVIELIDKELSLGQQTGTAVRKLANALNQNSTYRQTVIEALDNAAGGELLGKVAGSSFQGMAPRGIMRPLSAGHLIWSLGTGNLAAIPGLAFASPRMMGEALTAISALKRGTATVGSRLPSSPGSIAYRPFSEAVEAQEEAGRPTLDLSEIASGVQ